MVRRFKKKQVRGFLFQLFMIVLVMALFYPVLMIFFMSMKDDMEILLSPLSLPGSFQFQIHLADTHTGDTVNDNGNVRHEPGKTFRGGKLEEQTVVDPAASL